MDEISNLTFHLILTPNILYEYCWNYKFYVVIEKKIRDYKIYLPFSHFKGNTFRYERIISTDKKKLIEIKLTDNYKTI